MFDLNNETLDVEGQERYQPTENERPCRALGYNVVNVHPVGFDLLLRELPQVEYERVRNRCFTLINAQTKPSIYYRDGVLWASFERIPNGRIVRTDNCKKESAFPDRVTEKLNSLARTYM